MLEGGPRAVLPGGLLWGRLLADVSSSKGCHMRQQVLSAGGWGWMWACDWCVAVLGDCAAHL